MNDTPIFVSRFTNAGDNQPKEQQTTWSELAEKLATFDIRPEKSGPLWSPCRYLPDTTRAKKNVSDLCCLVLDIDDGTRPEELEAGWTGLEYIIHSTYHNGREKPAKDKTEPACCRWRAVFPLARPVAGDEWDNTYKAIASALAGKHWCVSCSDASRMFYLPMAPDAASTFVKHHIGNFLNPADFTTPPVPAVRPVRVIRTVALDDHALLDKMFASKHGSDIEALWHGDTAAHADDDSRADLALCSHLAFWCDGETKRIDRLFRQSGLFRPKWDEPHYADGVTYGEATVQKAITTSARISDTYPNMSTDSIEAHLQAVESEPVGRRPAFLKNETGAAQRFVWEHGRDLRYCHVTHTWLVWDGKRWCPDATAEVMRRAKRTARGILREASECEEEEERKRLLAHWREVDRKSGLQAMIFLAQSEPGIPVLPTELDADPWLLNVQNGTLNLRTGELQPHKQADLITKIAPVVYDPAATHPLLDDLLERVTNGNQDIQDYLRRCAGCSITGNTREEKAFILVSEGGGGKTTFLEALAKTLGEYAITAELGTFLQKKDSGGPRDDIAALAGARLVVGTEADRGRKLAPALFKRLTGGDTIRARRLYENSFEFKPQFTLWMAANDAPEVPDNDSGVWRRLRRIPWTPIPAGERNPQVKDALTDPTDAGPAILAWAVRGCLEWQRDGLGEPAAVTDATEEYRRENDPFSGFVEQCCVLGPDKWARVGELRAAYEEWASENSTHTLNGKDMTERLKALGCKPGNWQPRGRHWQGIGVLAELPPENTTPTQRYNTTQRENPETFNSPLREGDFQDLPVVRRCGVVSDDDTERI